MGDIVNFDILDVQRRIEGATRAGPRVMIMTAGPPCADFPQLGAGPPGIEGATGWLSQPMLNVEHMIRSHFTRVPIETVIENVPPHPTLKDDLLEMTSVLAVEPIVVDASDSGLIHRKRLWRTTISWEAVEARTNLELHTVALELANRHRQVVSV
eukprot:s4087_g7.t1